MSQSYRELVVRRLKELGIEEKEKEKVDYVISRVQPLMNDGCPSVIEAIRVALDEAVQGGQEANRLHGSDFREA